MIDKSISFGMMVTVLFTLGLDNAVAGPSCVEQPNESCCYDFWTTPAGQSQASFVATPIPAGAFVSQGGLDSTPYDGVVSLVGVPFGADGDPHTPSTADTVVWRDGEPDVCCPGPIQDTVAVRLYALSMASTSPAIIEYDDGRTTEQWDMTVGLSCLAVQPVGTLTATRENCTGGTFDSSFIIYPRFVFTRVSDSAEVVIDLGAAGGITLIADDVPFLCQLPPSGGVSGPDGFYPGAGNHSKGGTHLVDPCYSCYPRPNPCRGQANPLQFTTECDDFVALLEAEFSKVAK